MKVFVVSTTLLLCGSNISLGQIFAKAGIGAGGYGKTSVMYQLSAGYSHQYFTAEASLNGSSGPVYGQFRLGPAYSLEDWRFELMGGYELQLYNTNDKDDPLNKRRPVLVASAIWRPADKHGMFRRTGLYGEVRINALTIANVGIKIYLERDEDYFQ